MAQVFYIHPETPQPRQLSQVIDRLKSGELIVYPTDSGYALGWSIGNKKAQERVIQLRQTDSHHNFTVMCRDISQITEFAVVDNTAFKLIKKLIPGPFTFILPATRSLPKWLRNDKRKSIGIRIPDQAIAQGLLEMLDEPMMSSSLLLPGKDMHAIEEWELPDLLDARIDALVLGGHETMEPTTVIDLLDEVPVITRQGSGIADFL